jgi:Ser/Thr protein kinase RdoA (MazF antagonist)
MKETPLSGGRVTAGVVRVDDTVRRPIRGDRSLVHRLLDHLESRGFEGTPRFLGIDRQGREILSYLPGEVPADLGHYDDAQLAAAAGLLRRFHDATADFTSSADPAAEVICHNDWGPPNAVFRKGLPYGLIDFDTIAPGLRLWDLGYSAFSWLDLGDPDYSGDEQIRRLSVFTRGYGLESCPAAQIAVHALARQTSLAASGRRRGMTAVADWAEAAAAWTAINLVEQLLPTRMWGQ